MDKSIKNEFNNNSFWRNFTIGAVAAAIAVDMMIGFPVAHYSIFGQHLTAFSSSIIVPPLDSLAMAFGLDPLTTSATTSAAASNAAATVGATSNAFDACVASGGLTHFHGTELVCHPP